MLKKLHYHLPIFPHPNQNTILQDVHLTHITHPHNDIQHLLAKCSVKPKITYSFRDDTLIMAFVKSGLGVTISQKMVLKAFARDDVESRPLEPASHRTLGLAFSKTANSVGSGIMLEYLKKMTG